VEACPLLFKRGFMAKKNKEVYSRVVNPQDKREIYPDQETPQHEAALARCDERKRLIAVADHIAKDPTWFLNWKWPGSNAKFPYRPEMRTVDKYYPFARDDRGNICPLLVDEPQHKETIDLAYEKQKILKELGFRHVVIEPDTSVYDALVQLGEL